MRNSEILYTLSEAVQQVTDDNFLTDEERGNTINEIIISMQKIGKIMDLPDEHVNKIINLH